MPKKSTITPEPHPVLAGLDDPRVLRAEPQEQVFSRQDGSESWSGPQRGDGLQFAAFVDCAPVTGARAAKGLRRASRYVRCDARAGLFGAYWRPRRRADAGCTVGRLGAAGAADGLTGEDLIASAQDPPPKRAARCMSGGWIEGSRRRGPALAPWWRDRSPARRRTSCQARAHRRRPEDPAAPRGRRAGVGLGHWRSSPRSPVSRTKLCRVTLPGSERGAKWLGLSACCQGGEQPPTGAGPRALLGD